ncbi:MAG TPA: twin transmembrane helix small protein [Hydrogenophaga sp.]|uniref:twin transmembrane helix small protein n=1 Tax=Hydrogenophaga sp. TaxID=1904254 RepID=UPI002BD7C3D0|nr:twin transmembrane helix small protein [Hydrogenophaga sp.]HMN94439.1 twin transmembrane helix small protein [Hydrogenophaga sp.]HMP09365.1 twin transmembrane helix small protein [Hydrogenophaga sp.]
MKYVVILGFVAIIGSLAAALVFMMRGDRAPDADGTEAPRNNHMARALAFRIGFSILLFAIVLLSYFMGWIQPTGLPVTR